MNMFSLDRAEPDRESVVVRSLNNFVIMVCWKLLMDMVCLGLAIYV